MKSEDKKDTAFADFIMQRQYEDFRKQGLKKKEARAKVTKAHKEYYGEAAKFYGCE
jgi:hypothetical protein